MTRASVTVVVPTKNGARTLRACLESIVRQSMRCGLVVVECDSVDNSKVIASGFADRVLNAAPSPSLQRNIGVPALPADVRAFERSMYLGTLEWPRFFSYDLFEALGGYDENLIATEDT